MHYFPTILENDVLIDAIFELCWSDFEDESIDTTDVGEQCLASLMMFVHNCCVKQRALLAQLNSQRGSQLLYKVHRYILVNRGARTMDSLSEWFTRVVSALLQTQSLSNLLNAFVSKREIKENKVVNHSSGITLLETSKGILRFGKDQ